MYENEKKSNFKRNAFYLFLGSALTVLLIFSPMAIFDIANFKKLKGLDYANDTINVFKDKNILGKIASKNKYSKTLEVAILGEEYDYRNVDYYLDIYYIEMDNFIEKVNKLAELGYESKYANIFLSKLTNDELEFILNNTYNNVLIELLHLNYFDINKINRYVDYMISNLNSLVENDIADKIYTAEEIVTYVNANLDYDFYTNVTKISDESASSLLVLVNKYHALDSSYVPSDLDKIDSKFTYGEMLMKKDAKEAFEVMATEMEKAGLQVKAVSCYRSYSFQNDLYTSYVVRDGFEEAETFSARPGYSEHQTGLAVDVASATKLNSLFETTNEYVWLNEHAHEYGFIIRYKAEKEHITGYMFEPWHYRFVGKDVAKELYDNNLTFDEYWARKSS